MISDSMNISQFILRLLEIAFALYLSKKIIEWFQNWRLTRKEKPQKTEPPKEVRHIPLFSHLESKGRGMIILRNADEKIRVFNNEYPEDLPRESYHNVLTAREGSMSFVSPDGNVNMNNLERIDWALRSYFRMNKGGRMGDTEEFLNRLRIKLQSEQIRNMLVRFRDVSITFPNIMNYESDAGKLYESFSNPNDGLSSGGIKFCVGATKVMHCLFPEFFIMLDKRVAKTICATVPTFGNNYNNFLSYWRAMMICRNELKAWQEENGDLDRLLNLDVPPITLTRIFDKCAYIMNIFPNRF